MRQQRHRTLPIPQVIPPAEKQADDEIGVMATTRRANALDIKTERKSPLRTPVFRRDQNERGISAGMRVDGRTKRSLTIPTPVRSTLAQVINVYRIQLSHYVSRIKPFGMRPDYPTAKVLSLINTSPKNRTNRPRPRNAPEAAVWQNAGAAGSRGTSSYYMVGPRRFRKALPVQLNPYEPPTY